MTDEISSAGGLSFRNQPLRHVATRQDKPSLNTDDIFVPSSDRGVSGKAVTREMVSIAEKPGAEKALPAAAPATSVSLWTELENLGVLHSAAAVPGPLSLPLGESARTALLGIVTHLQRKGVSFECARSLRIPFVMDKYVPAEAGEVVDAFSKGGAKTGIAYSREPGPALPNREWVPEKNVPVNTLDELRGLDGIYGEGLEALPAKERGWMEAVNDLQGLNWQFGTGYGSESNPFARSLFQPYEVLRALREERQLFIGRPGDRQCILIDRNDLLAMAMLETGHDHGVSNPDVVRNIMALRDGGAGTGHNAKGLELELFRSLSRGHSVRMAYGTGATLSMSPTDASDPQAVLARLKQLDDLYVQYLEAPLHRTINSQDYNQAYDFCMETGTRFSPHVRAAALRDLFPAATNRHGYVDMPFLFKLTRCFENNATDELDLKRRVGEYMADFGKKSSTYPGESYDLPLDSEPGEAQQSPGHIRLLEIYRRFLDAARSEGAASDGLDLVRMPTGNESEEQRVQLFIDIAEASTDNNRKNAADAYRALLIHRQPDQSLLEAGGILLKLMKYLGPSDKQDRALEVFAGMQQGSSTVDEAMLNAFGRALVTNGSVDDALKAALRVHASGESGAQMIDTYEDVVVIGGIPLKIHDDSEPDREREAPLSHHSEAGVIEEPSVPQKDTEFPPMSREELDRQFLDGAFAGVINHRSDFEPIYSQLLKPHPRFSSQVRAAVMKDLIPIFTTSSGYLEVRDLIALSNRVEKRPVNDDQLAWLARNYIATVNERHGPYGTDADGPKGTHVSTPKEMFEDLVKQQGGGEFAVLLMTSTRAEVRKWLAAKLVDSGDLSVAHSEKENAREARAALLKRLEDATGSSATGADTLNLISIPVGRETENERISLLLDIAGADRPDLATRHYRAILMNRRPEQGLVETGRRYLDLLKSLAACKQQERSVEVFAALQAAPEEAVTSFRKRLSEGGTLDDALQFVKAPPGDTIMVGGAVLKADRQKKQASHM